MKFEKIQVSELRCNPFDMIGKDSFLITAGNKNGFNTMTAGWGYLGILWNRPAAIVLVRPSRYTYGYMEREEYFTACFFGGEYSEQLKLCGSKSGRDIDKVAATGFTPAFSQCGAPYFEEAKLVLVCKRRFERDMTADDVPENDKNRFFKNKDYHRIYFSEIVEILERR
jgi:flavin reductase (DIM6/NTAB) family NADH-FMN oxidoreductase RutF